MTQECERAPGVQAAWEVQDDRAVVQVIVAGKADVHARSLHLCVSMDNLVSLDDHTRLTWL